MLNNINTKLEHIIAKIDNDFNIDNSDWIPRVPAWVIDALGQLRIKNKFRKKFKVPVNGTIARSECNLNDPNLIVFDCNGRELRIVNGNDSCGCSPSTGKERVNGSYTAGIVNNHDANYAPDLTVANHVLTKDYNHRYNITEHDYCKDRLGYVLVDDYTLELTEHTDYIYIETDVVRTYQSDVYGMHFPCIPNNEIVIEAITQFCLYKMLSRGYKHPVYNLQASQYGTNPFYNWTSMKAEAKRSYIIDAQGDNIDDKGLWQSAFYLSTFG